MPIISKESWDKLTQEEKEEIRELYSSLMENMRNEEAGSENNITYSIIHDRYISLFGREQLQPQPLTYEDVEKEMDYYYSGEMIDKEKAIHQLLLVAKFLNKDWKPDWNDDWKFIGHKAFIYISEDNKVNVTTTEEKEGDNLKMLNFTFVYFRTEELARQAIQILGEDTVRLALSTDW